MPEHKGCTLRRAAPVALLEMDARPPSRHIKFIEIEVALCRVSNAVTKIADRQTISTAPHRGGRQIGVSASRVVLIIICQRESQTLFELDAPGFIMSEQLCRPDIVQRVNKRLRSAQFFG